MIIIIIVHNNNNYYYYYNYDNKYKINIIPLISELL